MRDNTYLNKIFLNYFIAPAVFTAKSKSLPVQIPPFVFSLLRMLGYNELLPTNGLLASALRFLCFKNSLLTGLCKTTVFLLSGGFDYAQIIDDIVPIIFENMPAG